VLPPVSGHGAIEFGNRLFSAIVMATAVLTWLAGRRISWAAGSIPRWSAIVAATTVLQVPLGGITVYTDLHPLMVASHFMLSMVTIAGGVILCFHAGDRLRGNSRGVDRRIGPFALLASASFAAVLVTGSLTTASGPHSGDRLVTRRIWAIDEAAFVHVRAAVIFLVLGAVLAFWLLRENKVRGMVARVGLILLPLIALQISIGEYQYRNALPWEVVLAHVSLAAAAWGVVVAFVWNVARPVKDRTAVNE